MRVGRFKADHQGNCHVRFNLPANHDWNDFWVTRPGDTHAMAATGTLQSLDVKFGGVCAGLSFR
jgi:hypothetical protein